MCVLPGVVSLHAVVTDSVGMGLCILSQDAVSVGVHLGMSCFVRLFLTLCLHTVNTKKIGRCISRVIET